MRGARRGRRTQHGTTTTRHLPATAHRWLLTAGCWLLFLPLLVGCTNEEVAPTPTRAAAPAANATAASGPAVTAAPAPSGPPATATAILPPMPRPPAPTPTPNPNAAKPNPKGAQNLTLTGPGELPETLDPALLRENGSSFLARQIFRGLVRLDDALNPVPDIAADYERSPDGRVYTFFLRNTAKFQSGKPITADDVAFSLKRACDPAVAGGRPVQSLPASSGLNDIVGCTDRLAGRASDVAGVAVRDPLTVIITIDAPKAYFLSKMTLPVGYAIDRADLARGPNWWQTANGSGPFRLTGWRPDEITLARAPGFYDQVATLEKVTFLVGARASNPVNLYDANRIDVSPVSLAEVDRLSAPTSPAKDQLRAVPQLATTYIGVAMKQPPLDQFNVRAALVRTVDRGKIQGVRFGGKVAAARGIVPPAIPGGDWAGTLPGTDGKTAKMLLPDAAAKALPPITVGSSGDGIGEIVKVAAERELALTVNAEVVSNFGDFLDDLDAGAYGLFVLSWVADYPDPENFLVPLFRTGGAANYGGYSNAKVDDLLDRAGAEGDPKRRFDLYKQAQQQILDDVGTIPLYHTTDYTLVRPYVKGYTITAMGVLRLETVWIER